MTVAQRPLSQQQIRADERAPRENQLFHIPAETLFWQSAYFGAQELKVRCVAFPYEYRNILETEICQLKRTSLIEFFTAFNLQDIFHTIDERTE